MGVAGDFLHEVIALCAYLAADADELIGVRRARQIVDGEDEDFWEPPGFLLVGIGVLGDEVFVTGYFSRDYGNERNVPIVRIRNLACTTIEEIRTKAFGVTKRYLIECRSIGGLSGSPVFLHQGGKFIGNSITTGGHPLLIGLIHGHFDDELGADVTDDAVKDGKKVNTGIAVVTPIEKVHEFRHVAPFHSMISIQANSSQGGDSRIQITGNPLAPADHRAGT